MTMTNLDMANDSTQSDLLNTNHHTLENTETTSPFENGKRSSEDGIPLLQSQCKYIYHTFIKS